ncbi:MAG: hypothetical protein ACKO96_44935, partial [Flammeovirgaceae bacterium]
NPDVLTGLRHYNHHLTDQKYALNNSLTEIAEEESDVSANTIEMLLQAGNKPRENTRLYQYAGSIGEVSDRQSIYQYRIDLI